MLWMHYADPSTWKTTKQQHGTPRGPNGHAQITNAPSFKGRLCMISSLQCNEFVILYSMAACKCASFRSYALVPAEESSPWKLQNLSLF